MSGIAPSGLENSFRVGTQNPEQLGTPLQFLQGLRKIFVPGMPVHIQEEDVVPFALAGRSRLNSRHVDAVFGQRREQLMQRTGVVGI